MVSFQRFPSLMSTKEVSFLCSIEACNSRSANIVSFSSFLQSRAISSVETYRPAEKRMASAFLGRSLVFFDGILSILLFYPSLFFQENQIPFYLLFSNAAPACDQRSCVDLNLQEDEDDVTQDFSHVFFQYPIFSPKLFGNHVDGMELCKQVIDEFSECSLREIERFRLDDLDAGRHIIDAESDKIGGALDDKLQFRERAPDIILLSDRRGFFADDHQVLVFLDLLEVFISLFFNMLLGFSDDLDDGLYSYVGIKFHAPGKSRMV